MTQTSNQNLSLCPFCNGDLLDFVNCGDRLVQIEWGSSCGQAYAFHPAKREGRSLRRHGAAL